MSLKTLKALAALDERGAAQTNDPDALAGQRVHEVRSGEATLHVVDAGPSDAPLVLFVHGYPDDHHTWDLVRARLQDRYRVASFDLRGMSASRVARSGKSHRMPLLLDDVDAVATYLLGDDHAPFHLVGHDWGSIIGWSFMTDDARSSRVLSYTSISGAHLGAVGGFVRRQLRSPRHLVAGLRQALQSAYIAAFNVPGLAERVWRRRNTALWQRVMRDGGVPNGDPMLGLDRKAVLAIALPGLELYRQNIRPGRFPTTPAAAGITCPVQLIVATNDPFVSPPLARAMGSLARDVREHEVDAGHWVQRSHPDETAQWIAELVDETSH